MHQSDNVALTFYLFSSSDAVERDRMHFTPKTYIFIAAYCYSAELLTLSTSFHPCRNYNFFCKPYANIRNWCPQCLGKLLSFLGCLILSHSQHERAYCLFILHNTGNRVLFSYSSSNLKVRYRMWNTLKVR